MFRKMKSSLNYIFQVKEAIAVVPCRENKLLYQYKIKGKLERETPYKT
jgi:hypothetical protein